MRGSIATQQYVIRTQLNTIQDYIQKKIFFFFSKCMHFVKVNEIRNFKKISVVLEPIPISIQLQTPVLTYAIRRSSEKRGFWWST